MKSKFCNKIYKEVLLDGESYTGKYESTYYGGFFNMKLKIGKSNWMIIDQPQDSALPEKMVERILGLPNMFKHGGYTLAIDMDTGETRQVVFVLSTSGNYIHILNFTQRIIPLCVLETLKNKKEISFDYSLPVESLRDFIQRDVGYKQLYEKIILNIYFDDVEIQIDTYFHRFIGSWIDNIK